MALHCSDDTAGLRSDLTSDSLEGTLCQLNMQLGHLFWFSLGQRHAHQRQVRQQLLQPSRRASQHDMASPPASLQTAVVGHLDRVSTQEAGCGLTGSGLCHMCASTARRGRTAAPQRLT